MKRATSARIAAASPLTLKTFAVVEADLIEGRQRPQFDVVRHPPPAERPQFLEQKRRGDDRRAGVEGEAVLPNDVGAPAGGVELLEHRDAVAARAEPHRRRQPAESAADHHRVRTRCENGRLCLAAIECQHNMTL